MIDNYVPSLELCEKLRDLGWKKETMFYWLLINEEAEESGGSTKYHDIFYCNDYIDDSCDHQAYECSDKIPAPTVGEMLEAMQGTIQDHKYQLRFWKIGLCYDGYQMAYMDDDNKALFYATDVAIEMKFKTVTTELSLCEVCALTLIHLLENNLVKLEES